MTDAAPKWVRLQYSSLSSGGIVILGTCHKDFFVTCQLHQYQRSQLLRTIVDHAICVKSGNIRLLLQGVDARIVVNYSSHKRRSHCTGVLAMRLLFAGLQMESKSGRINIPGGIWFVVVSRGQRVSPDSIQVVGLNPIDPSIHLQVIGSPPYHVLMISARDFARCHLPTQFPHPQRHNEPPCSKARFCRKLVVNWIVMLFRIGDRFDPSCCPSSWQFGTSLFTCSYCGSLAAKESDSIRTKEIESMLLLLEMSRVGPALRPKA